MDLNESMTFKSSSSSSRLHNFMQVPAPTTIHNQVQPTFEVGQGSVQQSCFMQLQNQNLELFWRERIVEMDQMTDHKAHNLPLARIKKIMKSDEDVKMISADAPILFSKACELFILELTLRSWMHTEDGNRRTLQRADIANAISDAQVLDFLLDIVPKEEGDEDVTCRNGRRTMPRLATGIHFPVMGANQVHQNYQTGEEVTGGNRGEDLSLWFNGVHFPAVGLNHLHQHCNYEEEMIGANLGGGQSQQFTGMHFPLLGLNNFDQNNYFGEEANGGGSQFGQSNGLHFPIMDASHFHQNNNA